MAADFALGDPQPNFARGAAVAPNGHRGEALKVSSEAALSWRAAHNIYAEHGTVSFFWRPDFDNPGAPLEPRPFPLFRVGYADHTSWDMVWLRIDWNGHGFDAFVTDDNLARSRVSWTAPGGKVAADRWLAVALTWDERTGIVLYVDGRPVARRAGPLRLNAGLDQFGPFQRLISPYQVQSGNQFKRGGGMDELRLYDHALDAAQVAALARDEEPATPAAPLRALSDPAVRAVWLDRYGWSHVSPPYLNAPQTRIRKVEFTDAWDLKARMDGANDGISETTWPGVYNRSRLPGRHDYFELPDWNVYVEGGKAATFDLPPERFNRVDIQGAGYGALTWYPGAAPPSGSTAKPAGGELIGRRPAGLERSVDLLAAPRTGGRLRFDNAVQETPLQEVQAFDVAAGPEPQGIGKLSYVVRIDNDPARYPALDELNNFIIGRYPADERASVVALPVGVPILPRERPPGRALPLVHVLIPADFRDLGPGRAPGRPTYGWRGLNGGLDGVALDIPALKVAPGVDGLIPLDIQIKDPLWPQRNLMDVTVSVKPGEPRTLFLDTRDRLLPDGQSLYLTIASAAPDFDGRALDGMKLRLVFKSRTDAKAEHVADRLAQARDNLAFSIEEHTGNRRYARYERLERDLDDLLRVDPENRDGRLIQAELNPEQPPLAFVQPQAPAGAPDWAFRQVEDLKRVHQFIDWWIDHRQSDYGDFGGGISDDDDLTQAFPGLALMGVEPDKLSASVRRLMEATYRNDMIVDGLGAIQTDELHTYEEGLSTKAELMMLDWGNPEVVERLMETAAAYPRIVQRNAAGHVHIVSSLYSGTDVVRDGVWGRQKPYSLLILHPGMLLADFNGQPQTRRLILDVLDGYLAHGARGSDGQIDLPAEIDWASDATIGRLRAGGEGAPLPIQLFWQAWRWTGEAKYLAPIDAQVGSGDHAMLDLLNADVPTLADRPGWAADLAKSARDPEVEGPSPASNDQTVPSPGVLARYHAWRLSGDKRYLSSAYAEEIRTGSMRMPLVTNHHWWSDRVDLSSRLLQRSRLGGVATVRNSIAPGHMVSWRFAQPNQAERVAILVRPNGDKAFKVIAYNLDDATVSARMIGWNVAPGTWTATQGLDADGDDRIDGAGASRTVTFERTAGVDLVLAPHQTTILDMVLATPGDAPSGRPDLGIGPDDVQVRRGELRLTIHSLGAKPTPVGRAVLEDSKGRTLATAAIPALPAPLDLKPKTATVHLRIPAGGVPAGARVRVELTGEGRENTLLNNAAPVR